jgi:hypothetical protein
MTVEQIDGEWAERLAGGQGLEFVYFHLTLQVYTTIVYIQLMKLPAILLALAAFAAVTGSLKADDWIDQKIESYHHRELERAMERQTEAIQNLEWEVMRAENRRAMDDAVRELNRAVWGEDCDR